MEITIIGTGYVGLVTGACLSDNGHNVTCVDIDKNKINSLINNKIPIYEPGLSEIVIRCQKNGSLSFSTNLKKSIEKKTIIFITVGTPSDNQGKTDLSYIIDVANNIGNHINDYKLIITKSTIPIGTTNQIQKIINNKIKKRNKKIKFDIANNPEFLKEGAAINDSLHPDRIIVGLNNNNIKTTFRKLYHPFLKNKKKLVFMDIISSELTKYASNAMLATKISFINEIARISEKVGGNINAIRKGIGSDSRIGPNFISPGLGYGGGCLPKDIRSIINFSDKAGNKLHILNAVNKVNENQTKYFFEKILKRFSKNKRLKGFQFGIWGLSYKPGTDDMRESSSIYIIKKIVELGGTVKIFDPKAMNNAKKNYFNDIKDIKYCKDKYDALKDSHALILITEWDEFKTPDFTIIKSKLKHPIIFDGRNQYDKNVLEKFDIEYHQIGVATK